MLKSQTLRTATATATKSSASLSLPGTDPSTKKKYRTFSSCPGQSTQKKRQNISGCSDASALKKGLKLSACSDETTQKKKQGISSNSTKSTLNKDLKFSGGSDVSTRKKSSKVSVCSGETTQKKKQGISSNSTKSTLNKDLKLSGCSDVSRQKKRLTLAGCSGYSKKVKEDMPSNSTNIQGPSNHGPSQDTSTDYSCAICLDGYSLNRMKHLSCGHVFHWTCIDKWLKIKKMCPLCLKPPNRSSLSNQPPKTIRRPESAIRRPLSNRSLDNARHPAFNTRPDSIRRATKVLTPDKTPDYIQRPANTQPPDDNGLLICVAAAVMAVLLTFILMYQAVKFVPLYDS